MIENKQMQDLAVALIRMVDRAKRKIIQSPAEQREIFNAENACAFLT